MAKRPVCLIIRDGWGMAPDSPGNAVTRARTPRADEFHRQYPSTLIKTHGEAVGLMPGNMGNSEVGHLNIGAGRVVYQMLTRISKAVREGEFYKNPALNGAIDHGIKNNATLHLMGLINDQGVHSMTSHAVAFLELCQRKHFKDVLIHAFTDGRDTPPKSARTHLAELQAGIDRMGVGRVATVIGRYFAMDRDNRWERVALAYNALAKGEGQAAGSWAEAVDQAYAAGENDEFIKPRIINFSGIGDNDAIVFFNYRTDRGRELTHAFLDADFPHFLRERRRLHYTTFTEYYKGGDFHVAFDLVPNTKLFGEVISKAGLKQLRCAETEKYPHVTFFFNGQNETPYAGEERVMVQSPKVATYDLQPEMSAAEIRDKVLESIGSDRYDVYIVNFANCDMVGHTGVFPAVVKAVEVTDTCTGALVDAILGKGGVAFVTADHGNAEEMLLPDGTPMTAHTLNDVQFIAIGLGEIKLRAGGALCDIAPTMLEVLGVKQPAEMTGKSLIVRKPSAKKLLAVRKKKVKPVNKKRSKRDKGAGKLAKRKRRK